MEPHLGSRDLAATTPGARFYTRGPRRCVEIGEPASGAIQRRERRLERDME
jgi:hypothetical protein